MDEFSIGVDLGGTNYRAAAVGRDGRILAKIEGATASERGREPVVEELAAAINRLREARGGAKLAGVGVALPGFILMETGVIAHSPNIPAFDGFPARDEIAARVGAPVILENDANAAALGEKWIGAGREAQDLILLTLGTGIGGGIISGGRILHGWLGMAGEMGHMTVNPTGLPCACGNQGCLEKHASATAIATMARHMNLGDSLTSRDVYELARGGSEAARRVFECMGSALGIALASLVQIFNYPLYLLSGGPLPAWDFFAPAMFAELRARSFTFRNSNTRVEKAALGSEAGLYGAAYLPFQARKIAAS